MNNITTHIAGPFDEATSLQLCSRCGTILKDNREESMEAQQLGMLGEHRFIAGPPYPVGSVVERGPTWQAIALGTPWGKPCEVDAH